MHSHNNMDSIWSPSYGTGSGDSYPSVLIQYVNFWEPMIDKLWSKGLDSLCRDLHTRAQVYITPVTDREFITTYLNTNGQHIRIIGKYSFNGSVQFTGFPGAWSSSLPYISNATIPDTNRGWGWNIIASNITSSTATGI